MSLHKCNHSAFMQRQWVDCAFVDGAVHVTADTRHRWTLGDSRKGTRRRVIGADGGIEQWDVGMACCPRLCREALITAASNPRADSGLLALLARNPRLEVRVTAAADSGLGGCDDHDSW